MASFGNPGDSVRSPVALRTRLATGVPLSRRTCSSLHPSSRPAGAGARAHGSFEPKNGRLAETLEAFAPSRSISSVARPPDSSSRRVAPWCRQRRPGVSAARANSPIDVSSDSFVLSAAETTNEPDTDPTLHEALGGESIGPGPASTGYLVFDAAPRRQRRPPTDANLVGFDPGRRGCAAGARQASWSGIASPVGHVRDTDPKKSPQMRAFPKWRDRDSNSGHHDFQAAGSGR
ncbi:MAG: hypothetical protein QOD13_1643 [Thermoleophilaceae bacterium]|jgi:hypothetical protein|nr:hypothetical protein [Thermoleophilaceae bacterium]